MIENPAFIYATRSTDFRFHLSINFNCPFPPSFVDVTVRRREGVESSRGRRAACAATTRRERALPAADDHGRVHGRRGPVDVDADARRLARAVRLRRRDRAAIAAPDDARGMVGEE